MPAILASPWSSVPEKDMALDEGLPEMNHRWRGVRVGTVRRTVRGRGHRCIAGESDTLVNRLGKYRGLNSRRGRWKLTHVGNNGGKAVQAGGGGAQCRLHVGGMLKKRGNVSGCLTHFGLIGC